MTKGVYRSTNPEPSFSFDGDPGNSVGASIQAPPAAYLSFGPDFERNVRVDEVEKANAAVQNFIDGATHELDFTGLSHRCIGGIDPYALADSMNKSMGDCRSPARLVFAKVPEHLASWREAFPNTALFHNYKEIKPTNNISGRQPSSGQVHDLPEIVIAPRYTGQSVVRKDVSAQKNAGHFSWDTTHLQNAKPAMSSLAVTPAATGTFAQDNAKNLKVIAKVTGILDKLGLGGAYLSGGAVLSSFHGGSRPTADLDFRIQKGAGGIDNFFDPQGQALIRALNDAIKALKVDHRNSETDVFRVLGSGGQTIANNTFLGVETSISIVERQQQLEQHAVDVQDAPSGQVRALSLQELQYDKLKTMLSRNKWADENIKKTAQDLFDLLEAIVLARPPEDRDLVAYVGTCVDEAINARTDEFRNSNPFGGMLLKSSDKDIQAQMLALTVEMANAHKKHPRAMALDKLIDNLENMEVDDSSADIPASRSADVRAAFRALCGMSSDVSQKNGARSYVSKWSARPGPPNLAAPSDKINTHGSSRSVQDIERVFPGDHQPFAELNLGLAGQSMNNAVLVLKVLIFENGFRPLIDSRNGFQTQAAFGLSANALSNAFKALASKDLVKGDPDGMRLTPHGVSEMKRIGFRLPFSDASELGNKKRGADSADPVDGR